MKQNEILMKEKEDCVANLSNQFESLKENLSSLEDNIDELNEDLELSRTAKDVLAEKVLKNKQSYEDER